MTNIRTTIAVAVLGLGTFASLSALAQTPGKKLYCWTDAGGHKICGDALPPEAADRARTEISAKSGMHTGEVARALTAEERAAAATAAEQAQAQAAAEAARQRRDLAMVESYGTEADLRRAYGERISLLDSTIKASVLGVANLRLSLTSLLDQASGLELAGKPVSAPLLGKVRSQHQELQTQQRILAQQQHDRGELDGEFTDAVSRYRALKQAEGGGATANAASAVAPASNG